MSKTRLQYSAEVNGLPDAWRAFVARDRRGYVFISPVAGGLYFRDSRHRVPQTWTMAGVDRFRPCPDLDIFKKQLRAFFILWGGREGPNIPAARRNARG